STSADLWFQHIAIVTPDIDAAHRRLAGHGVTPITQGGPQRLPPSTGSVTAYKFRDPDGHPLELIHFPGSSALATGFDHSALSVADAARSIAFYTGRLGFTLASQGVNTGSEQDRLDGLADVIVDVVALRPAAEATPHVELLAYRTPRGRPASAFPKPSDIAADRLIVQVDDLAAMIDATAIVALADATRAALLRDPDGHLIVVMEAP
ncbi:MAG: VOC family protein, partial [Acetobacteraceae bacterium]